MLQRFIRQKFFQNKESFEILIYIVVLFFISRLLLTFVGVTSRNYFEKINDDWYEWNYSEYTFLDIWSVWDSGWYLDIAENGYSQVLMSDIPKKTVPGQTNIGFFPLYPALMGILGRLIGNFHSAGLLISNTSLILSGIYLYKLALLDHPKPFAKKSVLYLFIFPTSFVLSGLLSESLFLLLSILSFYYAKKGSWWMSGIFGFFLTLTRPSGIICLIPILFLYHKNNKFKLKSNFISLLMYPAGIFLFFLYLYFLTGNFFAYISSKYINWGATFSNPILTLYELFAGNFSTLLIAMFAVFDIFIIYWGAKKIKFEYTFLAAVSFLFILTNGFETAISIPRMSASIFPLFFALSAMSDNKVVNLIIPIVLILIQIAFMELWSNGRLII